MTRPRSSPALPLEALVKSLHFQALAKISQTRSKDEASLDKIRRNWITLIPTELIEIYRPIRVNGGELVLNMRIPKDLESIQSQRRIILGIIQRRLKVPIDRVSVSLTEGREVHHRKKRFFTSHPSYQNAQEDEQDSDEVLTVFQAFERWKQVVFQNQRVQPACPLCQSATPKGELDRWRSCQLCASTGLSLDPVSELSRKVSRPSLNRIKKPPVRKVLPRNFSDTEDYIPF